MFLGESDWLYRRTFGYPQQVAPGDCIVLCFDGLDTFATVWLNGRRILTSDNMFVSHRVEVGSQLDSGENELLILFESALRRGKEREAIYGKQAVWNGDTSRVYVRKAQYHYGWDWGPTLLTAGPWKQVRLEWYQARISDLYCPVAIAPDYSSALLSVNLTCECSAASQLSELVLHLALYDPLGEKVDEQAVPITENTVRHDFTLSHPQLWWPRGYGEQAMYRVVASLRQGSQELDSSEQRIGLRRLELVQRPVRDGSGTTFFFSVNDTPIYCGGANWIPADSFLPSIAPDRYRAWLQRAADAHMTMVRVWGGGIYEDDVFYDTCDELGLLVWQDFMFSCGIYPALDWFQKSVRAEVEAALLRLRNHPSVVLWCGNNEDYLLAQSLGTYDGNFSGDFAATAFPGRTLYEQLLPHLCAQFDTQRPYWPGSPYGGRNVNEEPRGDLHAWHVWNEGVPYQDYAKTKARFVSEFGMESFPARATIESFAPAEERYPQSRTLDFHNRSEGASGKLVRYMVENIRIPSVLSDYIYATQFIQAQAMSAGIRGWRRYWGKSGELTGGALLWQLNDCWPGISWSIVDYALRPKAAYYVVKRELAPFVVGLAPSSGGYAEVWAVSGTAIPVAVNVEVCTWSLDGVLMSEEELRTTLGANQGTELGRVQYNEMLMISARLQRDGVTIARCTLWPEPFKYLTLPNPEISIERKDGNTLRVQARRPAKGVWLSANDGVEWSDNMLDLMPNDAQIIKVQGLDAATIQVRYLSDDYAKTHIYL